MKYLLAIIVIALLAAPTGWALGATYGLLGIFIGGVVGFCIGYTVTSAVERL